MTVRQGGRSGPRWQGKANTLFPDAVQREAHKGVYARLRGLCGAVRR